MGVIESVKKGFSVAGASKQLILVLFAFSFAWNLIQLPFQGDEVNPTVSWSFMVLTVVFVFLSIFMQAGSLGFIEQVIKTGAGSLATFKQSGMKNYLGLLGVGVIVALYIVVLAVIAILIMMLGGQQPNPVVIGISGIIAVIGMIGLLFFFLAPYAVVADGVGSIKAIQTSITTVKANFLKVLGLGVALILIGIAIGLIMGAILGLVVTFLPVTPAAILTGFVTSLVNSYLGVVTTAAFMAYYLSVKQPALPTNPLN